MTTTRLPQPGRPACLAACVLVLASPGDRPGGLISVVVWGPPAQCESGVMFAELGPLLPPAPPDAPGAIAWSDDGQLRGPSSSFSRRTRQRRDQ